MITTRDHQSHLVRYRGHVQRVGRVDDEFKPVLRGVASGASIDPPRFILARGHPLLASCVKPTDRCVQIALHPGGEDAHTTLLDCFANAPVARVSSRCLEDNRFVLFTSLHHGRQHIRKPPILWVRDLTLSKQVKDQSVRINMDNAELVLQSSGDRGLPHCLRANKQYRNFSHVVTRRADEDIGWISPLCPARCWA